MTKPTTYRECPKHGITKYAQREYGGGIYWKCCACEYDAVKKRRRKIKERLIQLHGGQCTRCGYDKCLRALSFHHIDPATKVFGVTSSKVHKWSTIVSEADKCILLCANCHMEIEAGL